MEVEGDYKVFICILKLFKYAGSYFIKQDKIYKFKIYTKNDKLGMTCYYLNTN